MNFFQIFGFGKQKAMRPQDFTSDEAKAAAAWLETVNPLRGMTATRMQNLYDASRSGDTVHLQWLYQEIEKIDPTLLICQQRRTGALASLDWHVSTRSEKRTRGFDRTLAQEQADCLELAFGEADQANFNDAVEHLARGFFRGFSHALPRWSDDGLAIKGFDCLDQWNFVRDNTTGVWYWNPEAHAYTGYAACRPIPKGELVTFVAPYHIDYPAMTIYLRAAVGEQGWAKFVERFGIPPVILTMPQDIPSDQVDVWRRSAEKVAEGGSGAVPFGTGVSFCDGARGINPFKDFVHNQRELVVLMSTGGLLTSLTESGSGTLAGGAHADTWAEIRRMDSAKIGSVLNRTLADTILDRAFPGRPHLAYFAFDTEAVPSPGEVFEDAAKAKAAGYLIDKADLEERTGYRLVKDEPPAMGPQMGLQDGLNRPLNVNREPIADKTAFKNGGKAFKNARGDADGQGDAQALHALLGAFSRDLGPAAEEVKALLDDIDAGKDVTEAAKSLVARLPELMPADPAGAAIIAEEMAKQFGSAMPLGGEELANEEDAIALANERGECESDDPAHCRVHGVPETRPLSEQLAELGYKDKNDIYRQADGVSSERVAQIVSGGLKEHCKVHEAVAALRTNPTVTNAFGKNVTFGEDMILHYLSGYGRSKNQADAKRLKELPLAMHAVKNCRNPRLQYPKGVAPDPLNPPRGTQYVYHEKVGDGDMQCRAWVDSGKVKGWFVK